MRGITLSSLAESLGLDYSGDGSILIVGVASLVDASEGYLSFLSNPRYRDSLVSTKASVVILKPEMVEACPVACLVSSNPYLSYARASALFSDAPRRVAGVDPLAVVASSAQLHPTVAVGPHAVIGEDVVIGEGSIIESACVVGPGSRLGRNCHLYPNATLYHGVSLGDAVTVHSSAVIGGDGFGFARDSERWVKIHQLGSVRIGDHVEIGAATTIDRGAIEDTVIGNHVIIDNLVMIAHNVHIGDGTAIAACTGIAGSARIGKNCTIAGGVGIVGHITIADNVHLTGACRVTKSINEAGSYASGTPQMETQQWRRSAVRFSQLDELFRRVSALEKRLAVADKEEQNDR